MRRHDRGLFFVFGSKAVARLTANALMYLSIGAEDVIGVVAVATAQRFAVRSEPVI